MRDVDVLIIGAGAAGLMCAIEAGKKGRKVLLLDHANKVGKKILMSGGGRCNFTNYHIDPSCYLSANPHFCKSALSRYTQWDFIALIKAHRIPFHEKTLGQLFCDNKAKDLVDALISLCEEAGVEIQLNTSVTSLAKAQDSRWVVASSLGKISSKSLVVATGGLSIPTMGATPFAYKIAQQFGLKVWPTRPGLVPYTLDAHEKVRFAPLSGISVDALVQNERIAFRENVLFTHRGLSGPAVLQISSYWHPGESIEINLLPDLALFPALKLARETMAQKLLSSFLTMHLPKRVVEVLTPEKLVGKKLATMTNEEFEQLAMLFNRWTLKLNSTEGYRTAEVTIGGVDCNVLSSKTMEAKTVPNLYFIGEALDVSGWLGGYNFQWAWSSGWAAGQVV